MSSSVAHPRRHCARRSTLTLLPRKRIRIDARISDVATSEVISTPPSATTLDAILDAEKQLAHRILTAPGSR